MSNVEERVGSWTPRTSLGKMVLDGRISSIDEIFNQGFKIKEVEIVESLRWFGAEHRHLPGLGARLPV